MDVQSALSSSSAKDFYPHVNVKRLCERLHSEGVAALRFLGTEIEIFNLLLTVC